MAYEKERAVAESIGVPVATPPHLSLLRSDEAEMLRQGSRPRGVGLPEGAAEGARPVRAGRHPAHARRTACASAKAARSPSSIPKARGTAQCDPPVLERIIQEHLVGGRVVEDALITQHPLTACHALLRLYPLNLNPRARPCSSNLRTRPRMDTTAARHPLRLAPAAPHARASPSRPCWRWRSASARPRRSSRVLDRVVLRPLPYPDPDRLTMVWETNDGKGLSHERISPVNFVDYRGLSQVFEDAAGLVVSAGDAHRNRAAIRCASTRSRRAPNFFSVIGVQPVLGAGFPAQPFYARDRDRGDQPSAVARAVRRRSRRSSASRSRSTARCSRVAGVMPPGFQLSERHRRVASHARGTSRSTAAARISWSRSFRLKPGVTRRAGQQRAARADEAARRRRTRRPTATAARARFRSRPRSSASSGRRCSRCSARRRSCCSSPAPTSRACCWRARPCASARSPSARRSARAAAAWSGSSSPRACCSR